MLRPRIIPCLLIQGGGLVKTTGFASPKYVGDPINAIKIFNEKEADEIIVLDIDATVQKRNPNERLIAQFAAECRMPLCYGGGIRTPEQAKRIISLGVEKVSLSAAAFETPDIISEIASAIGSQSVVVVLDVRRTKSGSFMVFTHNGTKKTGIDLTRAAREAEQRGAGEIVVNSVDRDGLMAGYDLEAARIVREATRIPVTLLGGAGSLNDINELVRICGIVGAAAGSLFVFKGAYRAVLINYPTVEQRNKISQLLNI